MKKILYLLTCSLALILSSCADDPNELQDLTIDGAVVVIQNVAPDFFDLGDIANSFISFDISTKGAAVSSLTIYKSYNGGDRIEHAKVSSLPATLSVTAAEAIDGLGITFDDLAVGDNITLSFEVESNGTTYGSGTKQVIAVTCFSDLAGTHTYTTNSTW